MEKEYWKCAGIISHASCGCGNNGGRRPNWLLAGHVGIIGHDHVMVSLAVAHYTNKGIRESKKLLSTLWMRDCCPERTVPAVSAAVRRINLALLIMWWTMRACR